jgi:aminopeptidase
VSGDPRVEQYAELLVETCVGVRPGWQVLVNGSVLARPLLEAVSREIGRRGAYALQRVNLSGSRLDLPWANEAPEALLDEPADIDSYAWKHADALIAIEAPENTRELTALPGDRLSRLQAGWRPYLERVLTMDIKWVGCQYPTPALAQDAGMSLAQFADFLYGACLLDWDAEGERMQRYAEHFDAADEVRLVADGTDLTLSIAGRSALVDAGSANMPGGEFFLCPVEDSAEGEVTFSEYPAVYLGREVSGVRLRFENGVVVDASAAANEEFLHEQLDRDDGARRLGELGIGCNPGITRHMKNTLFDEKMDGTVHLALGNGLPDAGGTNESQVHWDIVKEMRRDGARIELDGQTVQESGIWKL